MNRTADKPKITAVSHYSGETSLIDAYGKVYALIFREKLRAVSAPLPEKQKQSNVKSS